MIFDPKSPPAIHTVDIEGETLWYCHVKGQRYMVWDEFPLVEYRYTENEDGSRTVVNKGGPEYAQAKTDTAIVPFHDYIAGSEESLFRAMAEQKNNVEPPQNIHDIRHERNKLLASTDWTQVPDSGVPPESRRAWAKYRQELRDIPSRLVLAEDGISVVSGVKWPEKS